MTCSLASPGLVVDPTQFLVGIHDCVLIRSLGRGLLTNNNNNKKGKCNNGHCSGSIARFFRLFPLLLLHLLWLVDARRYTFRCASNNKLQKQLVVYSLKAKALYTKITKLTTAFVRSISRCGGYLCVLFLNALQCIMYNINSR